MPDKEFLEKYPLYRKFKFQLPGGLHDLPKAMLNFHCDKCKSTQTYVMGEYHNSSSSNVLSSIGTNVLSSIGTSLHCIYTCVSCRNDKREFFIKTYCNKNLIMKTGQFPHWEMKGDTQIEKMLGSHRDYLSRGLMCESQGYGVGAFAYYRRIVEDIIDELIRDVGELIPKNERDKFNEALEKVSQTRQTSDKIALVKDLLPTTLQIDEMNPLGILYSKLSEGLHADNDEECLVHAETIRLTLVYLASQVTEIKNSKLEFSNQMRKILEKR